MSLANCIILRFLTSFSITVFLFFLSPINVLAVDCKAISKDLNDSYNSFVGKGGLWSLMEKSEALKTKSMMGMQADSKLRRAVTIYDDHCMATPKNLNVELAREIASLLDEGRMITNNKPETTPANKLMKSVENLLANANKLLDKIDK
tara:strand:- start:657 stop:1100 length:444 start_codon:yes stop_codon:yes gene_type:complete